MSHHLFDLSRWKHPQPHKTSAGTVSRVSPRLYIGGYIASCDPTILVELEITHILKLYADSDRVIVDMTSGEELHVDGYVKYPHIEYLVVECRDDENDDRLHQSLGVCLEFIDRVLTEDTRHKIIVHCHMGVSRSATVVLAYLMTRRLEGCDSLSDALTHLKSIRPEIKPNHSFMRLLQGLDDRQRTY